MRKNRLFTTICLMAVALLAACTQDELAEQGNTLPDGEYPLQIGSVSITAESGEQPWTRVTENEDGTGSEWEWDGMEKFAVRLGDETAVYTLNPDHTMTADRQLYWKSTAPATVTAWYPATDGALDLGGQDNGLVYVLRATADNANHNTPVNLQFEHQLAKVRVVTKGTVNVGSISIQYPDLCVVNEGIVTSGGSRVDLDLYKTYYEGIGTCWEINLPVGNVEACSVAPIENSAMMMYVQLTSPVTLEAGKVHTITITANSEGTQTIDLANNDYIINNDGIYYFSGTASHAIRVTGGKPNIYLEDAQISVSSGNAIDIQGNASPTIHVKGNDNEVSSSDGAGIYVAGSSTVTITGRSRDDALTTRGGNGGSGIGGNHATCGNIEISNMTVHAHGSDENGDFLSAGIGGSGNNGCGTITIDNATISAYGASDGAAGNMSSPGIGGGLDGNNKGTYSTITIKNNSQVSVQRGSNRSDYIGSGGSTMNPANSPNGIDATVDETSTITPLN
ncbi:fimbrillin family protein [Phocaeicola plebeius]|uniref:fimbrillin family protein n=1 Tax=Phocaeicola plebeius TaxID=310297 RepID=UPI00307D31FB